MITQMVPFTSVEEAVKFLTAQSESFDRALSDELQDEIGMNLAIVTDAALANDFWPAGFDQMDGFRLYRFRNSSSE